MLEKKKKNTTWGIQEVSNFNVDLIKEDVLLFSDEWKLDTSRQDNNVTHKDTEMYPIRFMDYLWRSGMPVEVREVYTLPSEKANDQLYDIFSRLESMYDGKVVRAEIVKMKPNVNIRRHVDGGEMLNLVRRCHIPIITNDKVFFTVYNDTVNMKQGRCYEINNSMPHSVQNASDHIRVHIIMDILPNEYLL